MSENIKVEIDKINNEYICQWIEDLRENNYPPTTIKSYFIMMLQFSRFIKKSLLEVDRKDIIKFMNNINVKDNISINTKRNRMMFVKMFYNWMTDDEQQYMERHPINKTIKIKGQKIDKEEKINKHFLKIENVQLINKYLKKQLNYKKSKMHYVLFNMAYGTGLRASELVSVKVEDIDFASFTPTIKVIGKGRKPRLAVMSQELTNLILNYLDYNHIKSGYIFPSFHNENKHITPGCFNKICERITKDTGIYIHPHACRHGYTANAIAEGIDPLDLQGLLGHESFKTTENYFDILNATDRLKKAGFKFAPKIDY
jgi:site-specific recombinase XerD